jgi:peptide/nickel transport system substrate-binding protein
MSEQSPGTIPTLSHADATTLERALRAGASRRTVMGWLAAGGMSLSAAGLLARRAEAGPAVKPNKGGNIRVAGYSSGTTDTVDPARQSLSTDYVRCNMFYNGLTSLDGNLAPQPVLAESIESTDAKVWTIKLRKGVEFHDGASLSSADVVYSLTRLQDAKLGSPARPLASAMTEIKAMGPLEIRITLDAANADLPVVLGTFHFKIIKEGTTEFTTAVGTGAYKCKEFSPGVRSVGVRNPNYWKAGKPYLDQVEFFGIADDAARVNALLSGDIQMAGGINPRATRQVKAASGFEIFETQGGGYTDLIARVDTPPTGNADFIMAMKYLMDREQMKRAIFQDYAVIGNDQPIDPSNRFYNPHLEQRPFDLDRARFHFAKSGIGSTPVPLIASTAASSSVDMAVLMQGAARKIGLDLDIKQVPAGGYWSNYWLKAPLCFGNINPRPSADILLTLFFKSDAPWNESKWKDAKFDGLLAAARSELDLARRKQMYWDMQGLIRDGAGIGIPLFLNGLDAHTDRLKGLKPIPTGGMMGFDFAENVWLA